MISKIIHYVWLGHGEKSDKIKTCIESWKQHMPDYEIKEWNETNFDINYNDFTKQSYEKKQYAFTSDVIRLYALYTEGGIYMDTDVFMYKPLYEFENEQGFTGFEDINYPVTATMGAEKGNPVIKLMLDYYNCIDFKTYPIWTDYIKYQETSTCIYSNILELLGINRKQNITQKIKHFTVYPKSYFFTQNEGYTWHSFTGSWRSMIKHENILYLSNISKLGGVESFIYYFVKKYKHLDIAVVTKAADFKQVERIQQYCPVYIHHTEEIECKVIFTNWDTSILDYANFDKCYMVVHADYSQPCYTKYPKWHDPRITKVLGITKHICKMLKENFNIDAELCYNPIVPEEEEKRLVLVSATRLSKIKGGNRMKALAQELDFAKINYVWYVFTNERDIINSPNVIFIQERLDVYKWIQEADYLVQLSDTEACSYSINEALMYGKHIIVTPLPYLNELRITNENALILDFNLKNIKEIVARIKEPLKASWNIPEDNYKKYLIKSKSKYKKELNNGMARIRIKQKFRDMKHKGLLRRVGDEIVEDAERAKDLVERGFAILLDEVIEKKQEVEQAVKEVKKEKAVKEKAVKTPAKKNAKK